MRVVIAGGGTAGHVFPAIALADRLRSDHGAEVVFVGSHEGQEARLVPEAGFAFHAVRAQKMVRKVSVETLLAPFVALRSVRACRPLVEGADVVVGMGGYVSAPAVLAARREHLPVLLHEQNAIPGLANRLLARRAEAIGLSFSDARARLPAHVRQVVTGNPIRSSIRDVAERKPELAPRAFAALGLEAGRRTVLVLGGSQGALQLDRLVAATVPLLRDRSDLQLLIGAGPAHVRVVADAAREPGALLVRIRGFIHEMGLAYAIADLAVARAGASQIAELTACAVPAILVPYPHATENHQEANAREVERAGAVDLLEERSLTPQLLAERILGLVDDGRRLEAMRQGARGWAKPDADARLASLVIEVAGA